MSIFEFIIIVLPLLTNRKLSNKPSQNNRSLPCLPFFLFEVFGCCFERELEWFYSRPTTTKLKVPLTLLSQQAIVMENPMVFYLKRMLTSFVLVWLVSRPSFYSMALEDRHLQRGESFGLRVVQQIYVHFEIRFQDIVPSSTFQQFQ